MKFACVVLVCLLQNVVAEVQTQKFDAFILGTFGDASDGKYVQCYVPELANSQSFLFEVVSVLPASIASQTDPACPLRSASIYIQHGAQPLLVNGGFPLDAEFFTQRTNQMKFLLSSYDGPVAISVERPLSGYWYLGAVLEPDSDAGKKGGKSCNYALALQHFVFTASNTTFALNVNSAPENYVLEPNPVSQQFSTENSQLSGSFKVRDNQVVFRIGPTVDRRLTVFALEIIIQNCSILDSNAMQTQNGTGGDSSCPLFVSASSGTLPSTSSVSVNCSTTSRSRSTAANYSSCTLLFDIPNVHQTTYVSVATWSKQPVSFAVEVNTRECAEASGDDSPRSTEAPTTSSRFNVTSSGITEHSNSTQWPFNVSSNLSAVTRQPQAVLQADADVLTPFCSVSQRLSKFYSLSQRFSYIYFDSTFALTPMMVIPSSPIVVNELQVYIVPFVVERLLDQGGTLNFDFQLVSATDLCVSKQSESLKNANNSSLPANRSCIEWRVDICVSRDALPISSADTASWRCDPDNALATNLTATRKRSTVYYPYPEAGLYFLALRLVRVANGTWNKSRRLLRDGLVFSERIASLLSNKSVLFEVSSAPCFDNSCNEGVSECLSADSYQNLRYSFCDCKYGYTGFACNNASTARSASRQLLEISFLTASNLAMLPAIVVAVYRRFWMEAAVYTYTMVASAVYHACDSETIYSFCVLPQASLSILDFFGSLSSLMVTVLCIAELQHANAKSLILTCSLLVALVAITANRFAIWSFVVPIIVCVAVLIASWTRRCYATRSCYPPKRDWLVRLLPGALLLVSALCMFLLLESKSNYFVVHSAWHVLIALACVVVLPRRPAVRSKSSSASSINADAEIVLDSRERSGSSNAALVNQSHVQNGIVNTAAEDDTDLHPEQDERENATLLRNVDISPSDDTLSQGLGDDAVLNISNSDARLALLISNTEPS